MIARSVHLPLACGLALFLSACNTATGPGPQVANPATAIGANDPGSLIGKGGAGLAQPGGGGQTLPAMPSTPSEDVIGNGSNLTKMPPAAEAPLAAADKVAVDAVAMATVQVVLAGTPATADKADKPFATLALGDRLPPPPGGAEEIKAKLLGQVRGSFQVDLATEAGSGKMTQTGAEPAMATSINYTGAGTEPLFGLTTELRGATIDPAAKAIRSEAKDGQGIVLTGGKNLFAKPEIAALPFMRGAVANGFGADAAHATVVSYALGIDASSPAKSSAWLELPFRLAITSETVPQIAGDLVLYLAVDKAAKTLTLKLAGPYTVKLPGAGPTVQAGTLDQTKTIPLSEAQERVLAALAQLKALAPK